MNPRTPTILPGGLLLATLALRVEQDLVSLRGRCRAAARECGLAETAVRGFSAAAYEAARLLFSVAAKREATLAVIEGPALQVAIRASRGTLPEKTPGDGRGALRAPAVEALRALVDRLSVEETPAGTTIALSVRLGADQAAAARATAPTAFSAPGDADVDAAGLQAQNAALRDALGELQAELQETNRGVVALFAELDDQAGRLRQAEDRLRTLLDSVQDYAICMLGIDGEITSWNSGAQRLFGYSGDEIIGRNVACFYTGADRDLGVPAGHLAEALASGRFECEGLRLRRGGSAFDAHVLMTPVRAGGVVRGFSLVVRDITERKRLEDDLRRRAEELAAANRAKEDFLATLSHELRTPLNAMLGWTRLVRTGKLDAAGMARALETIERNAHMQEQLIADILDVSRIVTGKLRLELRPLELAPVVDAALDAVRPTAEAKGIALGSRVDFTGTVLGDPDRLQQVVWNLLANAIKFTSGGGRVQVNVDRAGPNAVVMVTDTGEGMPPELVPFVFDRFTQGDGSVTRPHGGLGLGLSIVRHIVELHGGEVRAWSDGPGRGSRFSVSLPVRAAAARDM